MPSVILSNTRGTRKIVATDAESTLFAILCDRLDDRNFLDIRIQATVTTLHRILKNVSAGVNNGGMLNDLGEIQGQGAALDVMIAKRAMVSEEIERVINFGVKTGEFTVTNVAE